MMVFYKARLAFLSVPKTGTTAQQIALREHADLIISEPPELKHAPVFRYNRFIRPMFKQVMDAELEILAVMREPVDWLGSWWRYRQRPFMEGRPNATHGISFDDFVRAYMKGKRPGFADVGSQERFLRKQDNGVGPAHLFRYDDSAGLRAFLEARLDRTIAFERHNESPAIAAQLSPDVEAQLRDKCAAEFTLYDSIAKRAACSAAQRPVAKQAVSR